MPGVTSELEPIVRRESSEITFKLLRLRSCFILTPVHQPDCNRGLSLSGGYVLLCKLLVNSKILYEVYLQHTPCSNKKKKGEEIFLNL